MELLESCLENMNKSVPGYLVLHRKGLLKERVKRLLESLRCCKLCPRECGVDRLSDARGYCRTGRFAIVASVEPHFGEESVLVGRHGSGTIFFSFCNIYCTFCQNFEISHFAAGREVTADELAEMMLRLQKAGCHNINFVTPTHVVAQIVEALEKAVEKGLSVPLVYNTGGYDNVSTLKILEGIFDIYMPDFKFWDSSYAKKYCNAEDYPEICRKAIVEMHRQVGDLVTDKRGIAQRGLIIRHLVMPGGIGGGKEIMRFIAGLSKNSYVNVMSQYRPCGNAWMDPVLNRCISVEEFNEAIKAAIDAGLYRLDERIR